jgi:hypothetical protein
MATNKRTASQLKLAAEIKLAKRMIAKATAAEKAAEEAGVELTESEMKKLGYVKTPDAIIGGKKYSGVWELSIPIHICKILASAKNVKTKNSKS